MSQLILDEHLDARRVLVRLQGWIKVQRLADVRPNERVLDDRVPEILLTLRQPTFITLDHFFWERTLCHPKYCILYFALADSKQYLIPEWSRVLLTLPDFDTRSNRMGKVAQVSPDGIKFWQFQVPDLQHLAWPKRSRKRRK